MFFTKRLFQRFFLFLTIFSNKNYWENCGTKTDYLQGIDIIYNPKHIQKGTNLILNISGILIDTLPNGHINYEIFYDRLPLYKDTIDICSLFKCPLEKGPFDYKKVLEIPKEAIKGKYKIQATGNDKNNKEIFCVNIYLQIYK